MRLHSLVKLNTHQSQMHYQQTWHRMCIQFDPHMHMSWCLARQDMLLSKGPMTVGTDLSMDDTRVLLMLEALNLLTLHPL